MISKIIFSYIIFASACFYLVSVEAFKPVNLKGRRLTPVFTPFNNDGSINLGVIPSYAAYLYRNNLTTIWLFGISGEPFSINLSERKTIVKAWVDINQRKKYCFVIAVGCGFLTLTDSCNLAAYCESLKVDAIVYKTMGVAGPITPQQAVSDISIVSSCAYSTSIYIYIAPEFIPCNRNPNVGVLFALAVKQLNRTLAGIICPTEQGLLARAYVFNTDLQFIVTYSYALSSANLNDFDAHSTSWANVFPSYVNSIDNAGSTSQSIAAQNDLNKIVTALCDLRTNCRFPCPVNIQKVSFTRQSRVKIGTTRPPLCNVTDADRRDVARLFNSLNL